MSRHADLFNATGRGELMNQFGDSVIYDPGGAATALQAIVGPMEIRDIPVDEGFISIVTRRITITRDPTSEYGGVADVDLTKAIEFEGENWAIMHTEGQTAGMVSIRCRRAEVVERGGKRLALDG